MNSTRIRKASKQLNLRQNLKNRVVIGNSERTIYDNLPELIHSHFEQYSQIDHVCRETMTVALSILNQKSAVIVETGSSAWGTNSSMLFDSYVNSFGGELHTVDIRTSPRRYLRKRISKSTHLYCSDSVKFLETCAESLRQIGLLYLDSWDVDWANSVPSAIHGLNEFLTVLPYLSPGCVIVVDDTPSDLDQLERVTSNHYESVIRFQEINGFMPGKGGLIVKLIKDDSRFRIIEHKYQLVFQLIGEF